MKKELTEQQIKAMIDLVYETTKNGKQMLKHLMEDYRSLEKVFNKKKSSFPKEYEKLD